ncbi:a-type inclusion protein [Anaeramoeba ignava]|uniref:A-type inclusion protein n=1 Tax=Anaeramoeba ignava TaxID=1746090 RepID=A0A9Q0LLH7_ANAIG|nr:a-type inclusion protein [Anaeramoeba ignava]
MNELDKLEDNLEKQKIIIVKNFTRILNQRTKEINALVAAITQLSKKNVREAREKEQLINYINKNIPFSQDYFPQKKINQNPEEEQKLREQFNSLLLVADQTLRMYEKINEQTFEAKQQNIQLKEKKNSQLKELEKAKSQFEEIQKENLRMKQEIDQSKKKTFNSQQFNSNKFDQLEKISRQLQQENQDLINNHNAEKFSIENHINSLKQEISKLNEVKKRARAKMLSSHRKTLGSLGMSKVLGKKPITAFQPKTDLDLEQKTVSITEMHNRITGRSQNSPINNVEQSKFESQNSQDQNSQNFSNSRDGSPSPVKSSFSVNIKRTGQPIRRMAVRVKEDVQKGHDHVLVKRGKWDKLQIGLWKGFVCFFNAKNENLLLEARLQLTDRITKAPKSLVKKDKVVQIKCEKGSFFVAFDSETEVETWMRILKKARV